MHMTAEVRGRLVYRAGCVELRELWNTEIVGKGKPQVSWDRGGNSGSDVQAVQE